MWNDSECSGSQQRAEGEAARGKGSFAVSFLWESFRGHWACWGDILSGNEERNPFFCTSWWASGLLPKALASLSFRKGFQGPYCSSETKVLAGPGQRGCSKWPRKEMLKAQILSLLGLSKVRWHTIRNTWVWWPHTLPSAYHLAASRKTWASWKVASFLASVVKTISSST